MRKLLLLVLTALVAQPLLAAPIQKKVLIIGIDGCRPDALEKAQTPNLDGLIKQGAFSNQAQTGDITVSGPGWSSMLTGVWREKHGVRDNKFEGSNYQQYPHFFRRLKEKRPDAKTFSIVHWEPIHRYIVAAADTSLSFKNDRKVTEEAVRLLREKDPDVVFVHLDEVDGAGHKNGFHPTVQPYVQAIERADSQVGQLLTAIRERKTAAQESWLILVSTDHGGSGKSHGKNIPEHRTIFLIVSGPSAARGAIKPAPAIVDVAATALAHLGIAISPQWDLDGKPVGLQKAPGMQ